MDANNFIENKIEKEIIDVKGDQYSVEAYQFILSSVESLLNKIILKGGEKRHISGQELAIEVKDNALEYFGPTALLVLEHWGIYETMDIGHIVYNLIDVELMGQKESDKIEDFYNVYDFKEEFKEKYQFSVTNEKEE